MTTAIVLIRAERTAIAAVARQLAEISGFVEVYSVSGRYDLVAIARTGVEDELAELITTKLARVDGILGTETLVAFRAYSTRDLEAGFSLGAEPPRSS